MRFLGNLKIFVSKRLVFLLSVAVLLGFAVWFFVSLRPAVLATGSPVKGPESGADKKILFTITAGEGFKDIAENLEKQGLIRSSLAMKMYLLLSGGAFHLQPGVYLFSPALKAAEISRTIGNGEKQEAKVIIPEGSSLYEIDDLLSENYVLEKGEFISWAKLQSSYPEGYLFPDTYNFFLRSTPEEVVKKMKGNFDLKARPLLEKDKNNFDKNLILSSILEKEVPEFKDRQLVAGILLKRLLVGMPLQIDATICYAKRLGGTDNCYPLSSFDFKLRSPYNTYMYKGLPPGPIGNPGTSAIKAALAPVASNYWFYLSDPQTKKTIFSETLDRHSTNRVQYLKK